MKSIYLAGGAPNNTAVKVLKTHLENLGHRVTRDPKDPDGWDVTVRWGVSYEGEKPALNGNVNAFDKYEAILEMEHNNINVPLVFKPDLEGRLPDFPWLARKFHHAKGKDIVKVETLSQAFEATQNGSQFFSVFIPSKTEYRVFQFHDKTLAVYEKVKKDDRPWDGVARNMRFGFSFQKRDELRADERLNEICSKALDALDMDFGGLDVLLGEDGEYYVLEINSKPHIENTKRSSGIRLAKAISRWAEGQ